MGGGGETDLIIHLMAVACLIICLQAVVLDRGRPDEGMSRRAVPFAQSPWTLPACQQSAVGAPALWGLHFLSLQ